MLDRKSLATFGYLLGALPLLAYPAVLVANVMALAASGGQLFHSMPTSLTAWLMVVVVVSATIYPVVWLACVWISVRAFKHGNELLGLKLGLFPPLFAVFLMLALWLVTHDMSG